MSAVVFLLALLAVGFFIVRPIVEAYLAMKREAQAKAGGPVVVSQTGVSGHSQPITGPASNTPAGAVAGQVSQNGVTDTQRLAMFAEWKCANASGGLWQDPWMTQRPNYAGTQIGPNDTVPPKGM